jgi:hypothetical protein
MKTALREWVESRDPLLKEMVREGIETGPRGESRGGADGVPDKDKKAALRDARVQALIKELENWPGQVSNSHRSPNQPFHKLYFVAELGVGADDVPDVVDRVVSHVSEEGPFTLPVNASRGRGGSGGGTWAWALCDAPTIVYSLAKMGLGGEPAVKKATGFLAGLAGENGFPCAVSKSLGSFRGPGRKTDPCPYATLVMLRLLNLLDGYEEEKKAAAECLLGLWERSRETHPYMFYMGNDFRKLKAPFFWFDILSVADVLSRTRTAAGDRRLADMVGVIRGKEDGEGKYRAESVYLSWKGWDFAQKKEPSAWVTYYANRILERARRRKRGGVRE